MYSRWAGMDGDDRMTLATGAMRRLLLALSLLCLSLAPPPPATKGLAQLDWSAAGIGDRAALGVTQWFAWGMHSCGGNYTNCTPMNRNWDVAAQTFCPPTTLLGNEPTNPEPAGHPITATLAASVTVSIEQACPGMRIVAANIHLNNGAADLQWLKDYLAAYKLKAGHAFTHTLGVHCYSQYADTCLARLRELSALDYGGAYWLTEFAMWGAFPYQSGDELAKFLTAAPLIVDIERFYIWTNRDNGSAADLVNANGTLTARGVVYRDWVPPTVYRQWLPVAAKKYLPPVGYP